jgi:hypothetical protein
MYAKRKDFLRKRRSKGKVGKYYFGQQKCKKGNTRTAARSKK